MICKKCGKGTVMSRPLSLGSTHHECFEPDCGWKEHEIVELCWQAGEPVTPLLRIAPCDCK
jgi:hypothetical protein